MSWSRYDDELPMNRKVAWLKSHGVDGIAALGLHLLANTWSRHEGHQGFIPDYIPEQLVGRHWRKLTDLLADEAIGMFQPVDHGWMINDYEHFGDRDDGVPVEEKKARLSKVRAEAGRAGGKAKASKSPSKRVAQLEANAQQSSSPVPVPDPGSSSVSPQGGGSVPRELQTHPAQRPSGNCPDHPRGTTDPCGACGRAKADLAAWDAEERRLKSAAASQQAQERAKAVRAAIDACQLCGPDGYRTTTDGTRGPHCDHIDRQPGALARARAAVAQPESRTA